MTRFTAFATALCVLVHASLGCCWHHIHAGAGARTAKADVSCSHGHRHGTPDDDRSGENCPSPEGECPGNCDLVAVAKARLIGTDLAANAIRESHLVTSDRLGADPMVGAFDPAESGQRGIRRHLEHQVLLI